MFQIVFRNLICKAMITPFISHLKMLMKYSCERKQKRPQCINSYLKLGRYCVVKKSECCLKPKLWKRWNRNGHGYQVENKWRENGSFSNPLIFTLGPPVPLAIVGETQ